jgi:drug/metabolite transporter (DMT)-like permease
MRRIEEEEPPRTKLRADAVLLTVTVVWGSSFVVVRHALDTAPPLALLFWRFAFALVLAAVPLVARRQPPPRDFLRDGLVLGALLSLGMCLQVIGQAETSASKAAFLTGLAVVLTPFVAVFRTRHLPTIENGIGITLASIGFFLLTFPAGGAPWQRGDLWVGACGVVFAFYGVELAQRAGRHDTLWLTAVMLALVTVTAGVLSLALRAPALSHLPAAVLEARPIPWKGSFPGSVAYLGSLCTIAAFLGWTWSQGRMSAIHGAIILALEPVVATLLATWLLKEELGGRGIAGAVLVLVGIVVSELRLSRPSPSPGGRGLG